MLKDHGKLFDKVLSTTASDGKPILDNEEKKVALPVYKKACEKVGEIEDEDFDEDKAERLDKKIEATLIKFEVVLKVLQEAPEKKENFVNNYDESSRLGKFIVTNLRKVAEDLNADKLERDKIRCIANGVAAVGGAAAALACPPLAIAGGFLCAGGNGVALATTIGENFFVERKMKEVQALIVDGKTMEEQGLNVDGKIKYSNMRWLSCPEELKEALDSLVSSSVLEQLAERVDKLSTEVINKKNMTDDEFSKHYEEVLDYSMGLMAKDPKLIEDYGKELAPAVMTFVFVVCLMNDHNRIVLDCSLKTLRITSVLTGGLNAGIMAGMLVRGAIGSFIFQELVAWMSVAINTLLALQSFIEFQSKRESELAKKITEAANKIEEIFSYIEKVHKETKKYKSHDKVAQWKTIIIPQVPDHIKRADIETAIKDYLPEEAKRRIQFCKLPLEEKTWLVRVPAIHSERLLQQEHIKINGMECKFRR